MAAPDGTNILDVTGHWSLDRTLSDSLEDTFALVSCMSQTLQPFNSARRVVFRSLPLTRHPNLQQGIPWIVRKVINAASLELSFQQDLPETEDAPTRFSVKQTVRPGGFDSVNEYILDGEIRYDTVPIFGEVSARNSYVTLGEVSVEDFLGREIERISGERRIGILEIACGVHTGWTSRTLWAFERIEGRRHLCKYATTTKDNQKAVARMVFDYIGIPAGM